MKLAGAGVSCGNYGDGASEPNGSRARSGTWLGSRPTKTFWRTPFPRSMIRSEWVGDETRPLSSGPQLVEAGGRPPSPQLQNPDLSRGSIPPRAVPTPLSARMLGERVLRSDRWVSVPQRR